MADSDFNKFRVDDARITKLVLDGTTLFVSILDWQERITQLVFADVIGIKGFGTVNVDLGGASELSSDPLIQEACSSVDEPVVGFQWYLFSGSKRLYSSGCLHERTAFPGLLNSTAL